MTAFAADDGKTLFGVPPGLAQPAGEALLMGDGAGEVMGSVTAQWPTR